MARTRRRSIATAGVISLLGSGLVFAAAPQAAATDWSTCLEGPSDRQAVFARAAATSGVPQDVLLAVSYLQSRWDDHGSSPSTSGGYGPMHLTDVKTGAVAEHHAGGKGETGSEHKGHDQARTGTPGVDQHPESLETLHLARELTGLPVERLRTDDVANICGGAALLASYQADLAPDRTEAGDASAWSVAVAKYSGAADGATARSFTERVFGLIREGKTRTTNDGHRVSLQASDAQVDEAAIDSMGLVEASAAGVDCPAHLGCESIPAPYEWYDKSDPGYYGNHDLADRQKDMDIDYIVIHDTEATWDTTLDLVTRPTYVAWQYSLRSSDGHIAQHLDNRNVGWHAGNWYMNMHSIGLEHEGFAAEGASWYTESMYQTSADLVKHLAAKYDVPLDRAHVIGHDQIPGGNAAAVRGMHWDPGPYWDWEHYMDLLGAPIKADRSSRSDIVTVAPGFEGNTQPITGCGARPCNTENTNFVYLHTEPSDDAPLVKDVGLRPNGAHSTVHVSDIGARAAAGHKFLVAKRQGDWIGVWYLGDIAWLKRENVTGESTVRPSDGEVVVAAGSEAVPVYGRAYPEQAAYPDTIPFQGVTPLQYTIKPGQAYVLADEEVETDYYYAWSYNCAYLEDDCTQVVGQDRYYQIWFGHRIAYVRAADVEIKDGVAKLL